LGAMCRRRRPSGVGYTWINDRLNRVFELNCLPYGGYPGEDVVDRRGKKPAAVTEDDPAPEATPATKKRKLGTVVGELGVSDSFAMELMGTCAAPGGRMSSPELWESSARMLEVTGGRWPKNVPIPRAAGEDFFMSRMAHDLRVFPYRRNIVVVVSAVMNKDRQDAAQKLQAVIRLPDARREVKRAQGTAKATVPGGADCEAGRPWVQQGAGEREGGRRRRNQVCPGRSYEGPGTAFAGETRCRLRHKY
jgi:hypothetical protein